jgi:hypothetical protein
MSSFARISLLLIITLSIFSCSPKTEQSTDESAAVDSTAVVYEAEESGVTGDFDGDGVAEKVLTRVLNDANANPEEPFSYSIEFSNPKMKPIEVSPMTGDGYFVLNEGNIDGRPGDELSVVVCNMDNAGVLDLYTFNGKNWNEVIQPVGVVCMLPDNVDWKDVLAKTDSGVYVMDWALANDSIAYRNREAILASAMGDFDGDGESENVYVKQIHGAPVDDEGQWEYVISFSTSKMPTMNIINQDTESCQVKNEGNKDGKPGDELSIMQLKTMGRALLDTYKFDGKKWELLSSDFGDR